MAISHVLPHHDRSVFPEAAEFSRSAFSILPGPIRAKAAPMAFLPPPAAVHAPSGVISLRAFPTVYTCVQASVTRSSSSSLWYHSVLTRKGHLAIDKSRAKATSPYHQHRPLILLALPWHNAARGCACGTAGYNLMASLKKRSGKRNARQPKSARSHALPSLRGASRASRFLPDWHLPTPTLSFQEMQAARTGA